MELEMIKEMRLECKNSIFLDEKYDCFIIGYDGMTGSIIYDIDGLSEYELITLNSRQYDWRIGMNGGVDYYEFEDAVKFWEKRFSDLDDLQKKGMLNGMYAPAYFEKVEDGQIEDNAK